MAARTLCSVAPRDTRIEKTDLLQSMRRCNLANPVVVVRTLCSVAPRDVRIEKTDSLRSMRRYDLANPVLGTTFPLEGELEAAEQIVLQLTEVVIMLAPSLRLDNSLTVPF